jgi:hypothetical protein
MLSGCTRWTTPTRPPPGRSAPCWHGCPPARPCRCLCSTAATTPPSCPSTSPTLPQRCWCGSGPTAASTPTRHHDPWQHGPAAPPRRQVQLRRPGHLAGPDRNPCPPRRPVRHRHRRLLDRAAPQAAAPPRPRQPRTAADRARHRHPRPGRTGPRAYPPAQGAVAVVGGPRGLAAGSRPGLAGVYPQVRPGTHRPVRQADPRLGHPASPPPRAGRPLDLAGAGRLRPAAPCPRLRWRPAPAVGAAPTPTAPVAGTGPARLSAASGPAGSPASAPKPAGCPPGRPKGRCSGPATRYPAIKKPAKKPRKKAAKLPEAA